MTEETPKVIVLGGPNGAGKSTMATFLVPPGIPFLNADEIAKELGANRQIDAGKRFFEGWDRLHLQRKSFAVESTLAGKSMAKRIARLKADGYRVELYFVWSPSVELNIARVSERVRLGGHDVPEETIQRRYLEGLQNLFSLYMPIADAWRVLYNATRGKPRTVARGSGARVDRVFLPDRWAAIEKAVQDG